MSPGANVIKILTAVIYEFLEYAREFLPNKLFQPRLMFAGKAGTYQFEEIFRCPTLE
jgi:hypothetical protein